MKTCWGWRPERSPGIWGHGALWFRPFAAAIPWITVLLLLAMMWMLSGTMVSAKGLLFDLPASSLGDGEATSLVALVLPVRHDTLVFFDDARYTLGDWSSQRLLREHLADRAGKVEDKTLLVLADRRVAGGEIARVAEIARAGGVQRMLFATKNADTPSE